MGQADFIVLRDTVRLAVDVEAGQLVTISGRLPDAGDAAYGVAHAPGRAGDAVLVTVLGIVPVQAAAAVAEGDDLEATADGRARPQTAGRTVARALGAADAGSCSQALVFPVGAPGAPAGPSDARARKSTVSPDDVTITEAAGFIETAAFDLRRGIYLVKPAYTWATDEEVFAAHGGLYHAATNNTLVAFNYFYNDGATSGRVTPPAQLLLLEADLSGVTFYVSWAGDSTTGSLTDVDIDFYRLAEVA